MVCLGGSILGDADAKGFKERHIVGVEGTVRGAVGELKRLRGTIFLGLVDFIQADGCFKHQENVKAMCANIFDDSCDIFRFGDRLVDCLAKLLDEVLNL